MQNLTFDDGIRSFAVNGDESRVIRICVTDMNLGKRIADLERQMPQLEAKYRSLTDPTAEQLAELDADIRSLINSAFGADVCTPAFGQTNCCSPVGADGHMLFTGFLEALTAQIRAEIAKLPKPKPRAEVQAYLEDIPGDALPDISALTPEQRRALLAELTEK